MMEKIIFALGATSLMIGVLACFAALIMKKLTDSKLRKELIKTGVIEGLSFSEFGGRCFAEFCSKAKNIGEVIEAALFYRLPFPRERIIEDTATHGLRLGCLLATGACFKYFASPLLYGICLVFAVLFLPRLIKNVICFLCILPKLLLDFIWRLFCLLLDVFILALCILQLCYQKLTGKSLENERGKG